MAYTFPRGRLAIVVGGGPAPGINGVISAVTIEADHRGFEVIGVRDGFKDLVNAFHGVYVPVDERYYHVNTPGTEQYSAIDIPPGYQLLNGASGLAFSRYRHRPVTSKLSSARPIGSMY